VERWLKKKHNNKNVNGDEKNNGYWLINERKEKLE
jgi:hypothetical protein